MGEKMCFWEENRVDAFENGENVDIAQLSVEFQRGAREDILIEMFTLCNIQSGSRCVTFSQVHIV